MAKLALLMGNTGLQISTALLIAGVLAVGLMAALMSRAGMSLRPAIWFGSVYLLIVLPQVGGHLYRALHTDNPAAGIAVQGWWQQPTDAPTTPPALQQLFGPAVADALVTDGAGMFPDAAPRWARFVVYADGGTAIIAGFDDPRRAEQGLHGWLTLAGLAGSVSGDPAGGYSGARPAGDRIYTTVAGCHLGIWSAANTSALMVLVQASSFPAFTYQNIRAQQGDAVVEPPPFGLSWPAAIGLLAAYGLLVIAVFVKGAAWAAAIPATATTPVTATELRQRLLAVAAGDAPIEVRQVGDAIEVEWRYGDARWLDHGAAHSVRRAHRLVIQLDADRNQALVMEYQTRFDASVGIDRATVRWAFSSGIVFFQREFEANLGVQLDRHGAPAGALHTRWYFNADEMKAPFIAAVRQAGWRWQPVLADLPPAWRWLVN